MKIFVYSSKYEKWVPIIARTLFGIFFIFAASSKIPGTMMFAGNVGALASVGWPAPQVFVMLAGLLELFGGLMLITGYYSRLAAAVLVPYIALLTVLFHMSFRDQNEFGFFIDHLILISALLLTSATVPDGKAHHS